MPGKQTQEPVGDLEAAPAIIDKIRLVLSTSEVSTIANGKMSKVAGIQAEIFLPNPGKAGAPKAAETFFGNTVGEVFDFLAKFAEDRTLDQFGNQIKAGASAADGNGKG